MNNYTFSECSDSISLSSFDDYSYADEEYEYFDLNGFRIESYSDGDEAEEKPISILEELQQFKAKCK